MVLMLAILLFTSKAAAQLSAAPSEAKVTPIEIVLVEPEMVTSAMVSQWKKEEFKAVAVVLDERTGEAGYRELARRISDGGLDLYCWIEVARNPKLAAAHPRWMAALGSHEDWQKNFPNFPEPGVGEVAKAFPWVPIGYREAFDAHLARIEQLLERAPPGWRGLLVERSPGRPQFLRLRQPAMPLGHRLLRAIHRDELDGRRRRGQVCCRSSQARRRQSSHPRLDHRVRGGRSACEQTPRPPRDRAVWHGGLCHGRVSGCIHAAMVRADLRSRRTYWRAGAAHRLATNSKRVWRWSRAG